MGRAANNPRQKHEYFLRAEAILKYLLGTSERIDTLIMCKSPGVDLTTSDYELYQAFGSLKSYGDAARAKITKLLENVDIISHRKETGSEKKILTHERVEELRKIAMKSMEDGKNG